MAAHQAPLSLGFSRQEYWSGLLFPSPMHACMLSCFSHVRLCASPWIAAHQALPSTGFSKQQHWGGLPFPSPVCMPSHFSQKSLCDFLDCSLPISSVHWIFQGRMLEWVCHAPLQWNFLTQGSNLLLLCLLNWQAGS